MTARSKSRNSGKDDGNTISKTNRFLNDENLTAIDWVPPISEDNDVPKPFKTDAEPTPARRKEKQHHLEHHKWLQTKIVSSKKTGLKTKKKLLRASAFNCQYSIFPAERSARSPNTSCGLTTTDMIKLGQQLSLKAMGVLVIYMCYIWEQIRLCCFSTRTRRTALSHFAFAAEDGRQRQQLSAYDTLHFLGQSRQARTSRRPMYT